ncbi:MAG: phosphate ABC transporter permease family protein, partial [Steroidobacteraceae bacterium]|nr:phosphate ABC transporter permease family protein [Steroidobacteraceae bacterium]
MTPAMIFVMVLALALVAFVVGKGRSLATVGGPRGIRQLHSLPGHYGLLTAMWCAIPALAVVLLWLGFQDRVLIALVSSHLPPEVRALSPAEFGLVLNDLRNVVAGNVPASSVPPATAAAAAEYIELRHIARLALAALAFSVGVVGLLIARSRIGPDLRARNHVERLIELGLQLCALLAVLTTIGIVLSLLFEALRFFQIVPLTEFLFGTRWSPQMAIRADQVGSSGAFGAVPLFTGTLLVSAIAMLVAVPIGLLSAIYLAEYAPARVRGVVKPLLEVLAGIPTVVYGFFAVITVGPLIRDYG